METLFQKIITYVTDREGRIFLGYLMENGAFYITSKERLLTFQNRISGNIKIYEMSEDTAYEIDEPSDWIIIEELLRRREMSIGLEGRLKR